MRKEVVETLSIFIDESGVFGCYEQHCPYYIVSLVLHEQKNPIENEVSNLNENLDLLGFSNHTIHTAPLIRREQSYKCENVYTRLKLFNKLFHFTRKINIKYKNIVIDKKQIHSSIDLNTDVSRKLAEFLKNNLDYFMKFDNIIVYYDNGQTQLTHILVSVFNIILGDNIEFRNVSPHDYKLFQSADFICTMALLNKKLSDGKPLTKSEQIFFKSANNLRKAYMRHVKKWEF